MAMRILNLDGHYFVEPFRSMGHDVLWIGPQAASDIVLDQAISLSNLMKILDERKFTPDLIVWSDLCKPPSVIGIEHLPAVTVGFSIDQYCNPWHAPYSAAFDLMLVAQKDYMEMFENAGPENEREWFPLFCNASKDIDHGRKRDIPVGFVGTVEGSINVQRKPFLDIFNKRHPVVIKQGNYVPIFNQSRVVLNQSAAGELNFRIFEAMACGAALLTEDTDNGLNELFENGEDILLYPRENPIVAAAIAKAALSNPEALAKLAAKGRDKVLAQHSSKVRAEHIIKRAKEIFKSGPTWRKRQPNLARRFMVNAYAMLATDDRLPLTDDLREFYTRLSLKMHNSPKQKQ